MYFFKIILCIIWVVFRNFLLEGWRSVFSFCLWICFDSVFLQLGQDCPWCIYCSKNLIGLAVILFVWCCNLVLWNLSEIVARFLVVGPFRVVICRVFRFGGGILPCFICFRICLWASSLGYLFLFFYLYYIYMIIVFDFF